MTTGPAGTLRADTAAGRWVIAAAVLGSGVAFLDGSVVNAALPTIGRDLDTDLAGLQWVLNGYLLTLGSFLVIGGSLGDRFGRRRVFLVGLVSFGVASLLCGLAPTAIALVGARLVQGAAAALLVPGSLAIISASFREQDRGAAIGAWSGFGGIANAVGPFLGGWLIDAVSWRAVFFINVPLIAVAVVLTVRHVPESLDPEADRTIDVAGGATLALGLGGVVYALIEGPAKGWDDTEIAAGVLGVVFLAAFLVVELRTSHPMVPLGIFRSRQFSGANLTTFGVYGGIGVTFFLLVVYLQERLGYSPLASGATLLPITALMLLFSARMGALAQRIGPRLPMTVGPLVVGAGHRAPRADRPGGLVLVRRSPGDTRAQRRPHHHRRASHRHSARRDRDAARGPRLRGEQRGGAHRRSARGSRSYRRRLGSRSAGPVSISTRASTRRCTSPPDCASPAVWSRGSRSAARRRCARSAARM